MRKQFDAFFLSLRPLREHLFVRKDAMLAKNAKKNETNPLNFPNA